MQRFVALWNVFRETPDGSAFARSLARAVTTVPDAFFDASEVGGADVFADRFLRRYQEIAAAYRPLAALGTRTCAALGDPAPCRRDRAFLGVEDREGLRLLVDNAPTTIGTAGRAALLDDTPVHVAFTPQPPPSRRWVLTVTSAGAAASYDATGLTDSNGVRSRMFFKARGGDEQLTWSSDGRLERSGGGGS